jgi:DNA primase
VLSHALDIFEFGMQEWANDAAQLSGREKSERVEKFMPLLSAVTDPVVRNEAAQRIADAFRLEFETVWSRVRGKAGRSGQQPDRQRRHQGRPAEKFVLTAAVQGKG